MFVHVLPLVHTASAVVALILGAQLLQYPNSHKLGDSITGTHLINSTAPYAQQLRPIAVFHEGVDGFDFNVEPEEMASTPHVALSPKEPMDPPIATPFLLAAIELAVLAFSFGVKSLQKNQQELSPHPPSHFLITESSTSFLLLFSPLLALTSTAQYVIWSPSVQPQSSGAGKISLFLILKALSLLVLSRFTPGLKRLFSRLPSSNWVTSAIALISLSGMNPIAVSFKSGGFNKSYGVPGYGLLLSCAVLSPIGTWVNDAAISRGGVRHFHLSIQALAASLCALFVSLAIENECFTSEAISHLGTFAVVSLLSSGSRISLPSSCPIIVVEMLRDQISLVLAMILGFSDTSSAILKISFLILATVVVFMPRFSIPQLWSGYGLPEDAELSPLNTEMDVKYETSSPKSRYVSYLLLGIVSLISMTVGLVLVTKPNSIHQKAKNNVIGLVTVPSFGTKSASSMRTSGDGLRHQRVSISPNNVVKRIISVSLDADLLPSAFQVSKIKQSRPFAVNAVQSWSSDRNISLHEARVPPMKHLPRREWDPLDTKNIPNHARDLTFEHVQIGMLSDAKAYSKIAFSAQTFGTNPDIQWTVFVPSETDRNAEVGDHSFYIESIKRLTGRYPVVMGGSSGHVFFKMLPYLFTQASNTTRWFFISGDDTIVFPKSLINTLRLIRDDPLHKSMYVGDVPDTIGRAEEMGWDMASGASGALVSRHLAHRIYKQYQWCLNHMTESNGDGILRSCVNEVTKKDGLGPVTLTRVPGFHSGDIFRGREREDTTQRSEAPGSARITALKLLSAKLSRTPCSTLFPASGMPSMFQGMYHSHFASFDFWHLIHQIPLPVRFRRFFINLEDGRTAVVTFGFHVRVYRTGVKSLDRAIDWDGEINGDPNYVKDDFLMDHSPNTFQRIDLIDYWLLHYVNNTLLFASDLHTHQFHLKCKFDENNILNMCSGT